jgi:hypothetical protein
MNYRRLGRKHARLALKEFFALPEEDLDYADKDALINKVVEIFFDLQLKWSMDPESKFVPPSNTEEEQTYHDSAWELITKTIQRSVPPRKGGNITNPEEAYDTGCEIMGEIIQDLLPEEESLSKAELQAKCRTILEDKAKDESIPLPKIHSIIKSYYDRGIEDTLEGVEPPPTPEEQRAARYQKLLMQLH